MSTQRPSQPSPNPFRFSNGSQNTVSTIERLHRGSMTSSQLQQPPIAASGKAHKLENNNSPAANNDDSDRESGRAKEYGFWAPELAALRKEYLIGIARLTAMVTILVWGVLGIYWGGLWTASSKVHNLTAYIINRDGPTGIIGNTTQNALLGSMHLKWQVIDPTLYPDAASIEQAIATDEKAWLAVEVTQDVSSRLSTARTNGDASWNSQDTVIIYYSEARANTVIPGMVVSPTLKVLESAFANMTVTLAQQYLRSAMTNTTALEAVERAPQTLVTPVIVTAQNLRAWDQTVATAPTFVGLIYVVILALNVTLGNFGMRQAIQGKLKLSSMIAMRIIIPVIVYLFLSFQYAMLNLPFKLHFDGWKLGFGAGFLTFVAATWCGMTVLGLIIECVLAIVGSAFIGFFLILLIIANVVTVVYPIPMMPAFFRYGYAMPFYHLKNIYVHIVYNTSKHILVLYHFGILFAWIAMLLATFPLWIVLERRRGIKAQEKAAEEAANKAEQPNDSSAPPSRQYDHEQGDEKVQHTSVGQP
ncbi:hypothetical protein CF319_g1067 [Tilletia indica]|nr:hypothetical protein CF319_g1067 [Tilletia indica]